MLLVAAFVIFVVWWVGVRHVIPAALGVLRRTPWPVLAVVAWWAWQHVPRDVWVGVGGFLLLAPVVGLVALARA